MPYNFLNFRNSNVFFQKKLKIVYLLFLYGARLNFKREKDCFKYSRQKFILIYLVRTLS